MIYPTDGHIQVQIDRHTDLQTNIKIYKQTDRWIDEEIDEKTWYLQY